MHTFLTYQFLIRIGLGVVFLANSLAALFAPAEFIELIENSFVVSFIPIPLEVFVPLVIGFNDGIVALLFFSGIATRRVAMWAFLWLVGVMVVIGEPFDVLEHAGLLFVALALVVADSRARKGA